ncbi:MAG: hypothetical protein E7200_03550 [Selenomonas ruminantium]|nr:hypothetical protein [Selenomonas ruminantium]
MAESAVNYKCPNCSAPLSYQPGKETITCEYCGAELATKAVEEMYAQAEERATARAELEDKKWETEKAGNEWAAEDEANLRALVCSSCGAEIVADMNTMSTQCAYCGNPTMVPQKFSGQLRPDYIIPFKKTKEDAIAALKEFYKGKPLLPSGFDSANKLEQIQPMYVPFWLFDAKVDAHASFHATNDKTFETSDEIVTITSHYECNRAGKMAFANIPVDGSEKMSDDYMESIEPFDYAEMVPFTQAYMTGFLADKYDVDAEASVPRADKRVEESAVGVLAGTVTGYDSVNCKASSVCKEDGAVAYAMAPVWILTTRYQDQPYTFMMNGQTGKTVGSLPIDKKKSLLYSLLVFALATPLFYYIARYLLAELWEG